MKKFILATLILVLALSLYAITKEDYYDNDASIINSILLKDPYPSKIKDFFGYIQDGEVEFKMSMWVDSELTYWYVFSFTEVPSPATVPLLFAEAKKTTGTANSLAFLVNNEWNNPIFLEAIGL